MASIAQPASAYAASGLKPANGVWSWITTIDHKRIGMLYGVVPCSSSWWAVSKR